MENNLTKEQFQKTERILHQQRNNFQALFMAVCELNTSVIHNPDIADIDTIDALAAILKSNRHVKQSKSFFLYRETATVIISIIKHSIYKTVILQSISLIKECIINSNGDRLRAVAEAAGSLPLNIRVNIDNSYNISEIPAVSFSDLIKQLKTNTTTNHNWFGRSLVTKCEGNKLLVIKLAKQQDNLSELNMECGFMTYLSKRFKTNHKFGVPTPLKSAGHYLFKVNELPKPIPLNMDIHHEKICIAFTATPDYFVYPNELNNTFHLNESKFQEIIFRSSLLFSQLGANGLIHTAPVPLFHNRVQQDRRNDGGIYDWSKGGRLDQWLESCRFPNFGESGIRDFEHFTLYDKNSLQLYKQIGSHILSLILVLGSFYRNIGSDDCSIGIVGKFGYSSDSTPLNARGLFNNTQLPYLLEGIVQHYYSGFTGKKQCADLSFNYNDLSKSIIDEMGVDQHMEEVLRIPDQKKMTDKEFNDFLMKKGYKQIEIEQLIKGEKEISISTGPHLGGFNQKISIPLLPELLAKISAFCILDKFEEEQT